MNFEDKEIYFPFAGNLYIMAIHSLAVFCGSKNGNDPIYLQHAAKLGKIMADHTITLIYGGGNVGIMGIIANEVMKNGGKVIGVIPQVLVEWEREHKNISELIVVDDMHTRKKTIYNLCDAAIALPGGFGTLDELFEMLTWNQLSIHNKQIFILNSGGFYNHLLHHIKKLEEKNFLYEKAERRITIIDDPSAIVLYLK